MTKQDITEKLDPKHIQWPSQCPKCGRWFTKHGINIHKCLPNTQPSDKRCKPCQLENNLGVCDRKDCSNHVEPSDKKEKTILELLDGLKVQHKTEGWTGQIEVNDVSSNASSSHGQWFDLRIVLWQDTHKPNGDYVEDPDCDLSDLIIL